MKPATIALLLCCASIACAAGRDVVVPGTSRGFMVTPSTSGKSYQASFAYDASRFGAQVRDAIGSNAQLVQSRTGSIRVWAHVPVVRTDGSVVYRNFRLAPVHGNGGSSSFWSVTPLRKLNASNDAVALRDGISFFSRTTDGDTVWYQAFGDNAKPAP